MASFCAVFFPRDILVETWDLIESVSEGFPTYSCNSVKISFISIILSACVYSLKRFSCGGIEYIKSISYSAVMAIIMSSLTVSLHAACTFSVCSQQGFKVYYRTFRKYGRY